MKHSHPSSLARCRRPLSRVVLWAALLLGPMGSLASAQTPLFELNDGNAVYSISPLPTTLGSAGPVARFRPEGGVDHLDQNWWWYRVVGDERERPFGNVDDMSTTVSVSGNTATLVFSEPRFTATYTMTLIDSDIPGAARLNQSFLVRNLMETPLSITLFNYVDYDLNGKSDTNSEEDASYASLLGPGLIRNTDAGVEALFQGDNPDFFQIAEYADLLVWLSDGPSEPLLLDNSGGLLFGPDDFTAAMQWNLELGNLNDTALVTGYLEIVPEPGPIALLLVGSLGLGFWVRKRRKPVVVEQVA